jgi:hypothetical protein
VQLEGRIDVALVLFVVQSGNYAAWTPNGFNGLVMIENGEEWQPRQS